MKKKCSPLSSIVLFLSGWGSEQSGEGRKQLLGDLVPQTLPFERNMFSRVKLVYISLELVRHSLGSVLPVGTPDEVVG